MLSIIYIWYETWIYLSEIQKCAKRNRETTKTKQTNVSNNNNNNTKNGIDRLGWQSWSQFCFWLRRLSILTPETSIRLGQLPPHFCDVNVGTQWKTKALYLSRQSEPIKFRSKSKMSWLTENGTKEEKKSCLYSLRQQWCIVGGFLSKATSFVSNLTAKTIPNLVFIFY